MSSQHMTMTSKPMMKVVAEMPQPVVNPNQYHLKKGHFANIMADGKMRRVDYIADNQGFHILRDTADKTGRYIKREAEAEPLVQPDLIRTRMTSYMDSSSLRDDGKD